MVRERSFLVLNNGQGFGLLDICWYMFPEDFSLVVTLEDFDLVLEHHMLLGMVVVLVTLLIIRVLF